MNLCRKILCEPNKVNKEPKELEFELTFTHRTDWKFCGAMTKNEFPDIKEFPCESLKGTVSQLIFDVSDKDKTDGELFNHPPDWSFLPVVPTVVKFRIYSQFRVLRTPFDLCTGCAMSHNSVMADRNLVFLLRFDKYGFRRRLIE